MKMTKLIAVVVYYCGQMIGLLVVTVLMFAFWFKVVCLYAITLVITTLAVWGTM